MNIIWPVIADFSNETLTHLLTYLLYLLTFYCALWINENKRHTHMHTNIYIYIYIFAWSKSCDYLNNSFYNFELTTQKCGLLEIKQFHCFNLICFLYTAISNAQLKNWTFFKLKWLPWQQDLHEDVFLLSRTRIRFTILLIVFAFCFQ